MRKFVIINTDKSPEEIRHAIKRFTDSTPSFIFKAKNPYSSKFGDNYINLLSSNLLYWPFIQIELREHIKPRLKLKYQGLLFFVALYCSWLFPFLARLFEQGITSDNFLSVIFIASIFLIIVLYAGRMQRKTKAWLCNTLSVIDC
ncbi:MAG TPA: hypothetical protein PKL31_14370 [Fulvivirga sp.]|nr:hypothetical protein [Fulvivirga sp.]